MSHFPNSHLFNIYNLSMYFRNYILSQSFELDHSDQAVESEVITFIARIYSAIAQVTKHMKCA